MFKMLALKRKKSEHSELKWRDCDPNLVIWSQRWSTKSHRSYLSRSYLDDFLQNAALANQLKELTYQLEEEQRLFQVELNNRDGQISRMAEESQSLLMEMQMLLDTKQTLDAEIAIYRKMLEGEENA